MTLTMTMNHDYTGLWIAADGAVRKALLPNGRYLAMHGRRPVSQGEYQITGDHIEYRADDGAIGSADFVDGLLRHAGGVLYPEGIEDVAA